MWGDYGECVSRILFLILIVGMPRAHFHGISSLILQSAVMRVEEKILMQPQESEFLKIYKNGDTKFDNGGIQEKVLKLEKIMLELSILLESEHFSVFFKKKSSL